MGSATATTAEPRAPTSVRDALLAPQAARSGRHYDELLRDVRAGGAGTEQPPPPAPPFGALDSFDAFWSAAFAAEPHAPPRPTAVEGLSYAFDSPALAHAPPPAPLLADPQPQAPLPTEEEVDLSECELETDPDAPTPAHIRQHREAAREAERQRLEEQRLAVEAASAELLRVQQEKEAEERRIREEQEAEERRICEEKEAEERRIREEQEAEARRVKEEEERLRREKEEEERRLREKKEAEERRIQEEKEAEERRLQEEAIRKRLLEEEVARRLAEERALHAEEQERIREAEEAAKEAKKKKEELAAKVKAALEQERATPVRRNTEWTRAAPTKSILRNRNSIAPILREEVAVTPAKADGTDSEVGVDLPLVDYDSEDVTMHSRRDSFRSDGSRCESVVVHKTMSKKKRVSMSVGCQPEYVQLVDYPKTPATKTPKGPTTRTRSRSTRGKSASALGAASDTIRRRLADDLEECGVPGAKLERIRRASMKADPPVMTEKGVSVRVSLDSPELMSAPRPRTKNMVDCGIMCRGEEIDAEIAIMFAKFDVTTSDGVNVPPTVREDTAEPEVEDAEPEEIVEEPPKVTFVEQNVSVQTPGKTVTHEVTNSILEENPTSALKENERLLHTVGEGDATVRIIEIEEGADSAKKSADTPMKAAELVTPSPRLSDANDANSAAAAAPRKSLQNESDSDFNTPASTPHSARATIGTEQRVPIPSPPTPNPDRRRPSSLSSTGRTSSRRGSKPFVTSAKPPKSPAPNAAKVPFAQALRTRRSLVFAQQNTPEIQPQEKTPAPDQSPGFQQDTENITPNMQSTNAEVKMASLDIPQNSATSTRRTRSMSSMGSAASQPSPAKSTQRTSRGSSKAQYTVESNVVGFNIPAKVQEDEVEEVLQTPPVRKRGRPRKNTKSLDFAINEKKRTVFKGRKSTVVGEEAPDADEPETPTPRRSARNARGSADDESQASRVESEKSAEDRKAIRGESEKESSSKRTTRGGEDVEMEASSKRTTRSNSANTEVNERTTRGSSKAGRRNRKTRGGSENTDDDKRATRGGSAKATKSSATKHAKSDKTDESRRRSLRNSSMASSSARSKAKPIPEESEVIVVSDDDVHAVAEDDDALIPVEDDLEVDEEKAEVENEAGGGHSDGDNGEMAEASEEEELVEETQDREPRRSLRSSTRDSTREASAGKGASGSKKAGGTRGRKRGRPSKKDEKVKLEEEDVRTVRRGKRARFPPLGYHLGEKVIYERRHSQQMPTIKSLSKVLPEDEVQAAPAAAQAASGPEVETPRVEAEAEADFVPDDPLSPEDDGGPVPEVERVQNPRRSTRNAKSQAPAASRKASKAARSSGSAGTATTRSTRSRTAASKAQAAEPARKKRRRARK